MLFGTWSMIFFHLLLVILLCLTQCTVSLAQFCKLATYVQCVHALLLFAYQQSHHTLA